MYVCGWGVGVLGDLPGWHTFDILCGCLGISLTVQICCYICTIDLDSLLPLTLMCSFICVPRPSHVFNALNTRIVRCRGTRFLYHYITHTCITCIYSFTFSMCYNSAGSRRPANWFSAWEPQHFCCSHQWIHGQGIAQRGREGQHCSLQGLAAIDMVCYWAPSKASQGLGPSTATPARHTCLHWGNDN